MAHENQFILLPAALVLGASVLIGGCMTGESSSGSSSADSGADHGTSESSSPERTDTVALSWERPQTRADGSDLLASEIDHYKVYYGTTSGDYAESMEIMNTSTEISGLDEGQYYFAVQAHDTAGLASELSNEQSTSLE